MAGNTGSPLCAELNRIANYGVYPDRDDFLEEQGAANVWAGTTGQGLLGALNYIVDPNRTDNNYKGLTAVCNELAGTTGLSDVDALRTINHPAEVLLKGTTARSASYYVDAITPRYNYPGYLYFNGTSGNGLSLQDSNDLDITGDIDIRVKMLPQDWTTGVGRNLLSKGAAATWSYCLFLNSANRISLSWSTDGVIGTRKEEQSTATVPLTDGTVGWVRAALDVNNGASGYSVYFYTSTDGTTWTQLGSTVTVAGVTSIYSGTGSIQLFENNALTSATEARAYNAQVFASINDTDKRLDVDLTTNVTSATYNQFTATTGQLVTINGQDTLTNGGTAGSLLPTTVGSSTAADSNDPKFLDHTGTNYVYLPGVAANHLTTPDAAALDVTGDIDLRVKVALDDWTPGAINMLISKWQTSIEQSYLFYVLTDGRLEFNWSTTGTTANTPLISSVATGIADGSVKWVRVTVDVDNGASGKTAKFYTSDDGTTWTQLGTDIVQAGTTSIFSSSSQVAVGAYLNGTSLPTAGKIFRAQILNGIDGTTVLDVDTSVITAGAATSFTAVTGQTITIARSTSGRKSVAVTQPTWLFGTDDYMEVNNRYMAHSTADENYVYLSGASGNYMSVADNPPLDVTGDLDLQVKVALDDWTPAAAMALLAKRNASIAYQFFVNATSGLLGFTFSSDGTTIGSATSTIAPTVSDGGTLWVRATRVASTGVVTFYTSNDGTTWTQLGTSVNTTAGNIFSSADPVEIGSRTGGTAITAKGKFFRTIIKNGIDGTIVLDADASVITLPSQTTFVDRSSNAYTVTINKSGVGTFVSTGNYLYLPGVASNYASTPDAAPLDITGDLDLRVKVALDDWTPAIISNLISKWDSQLSYELSVTSTGALALQYSTNGSSAVNTTSSAVTGITDGATKWVRATLDVDNGALGNTITFFTSDDGITWTTLGSPVVTLGIASIYNGTAPVAIGARFAGTNAIARGKFFRAQVLNGINGTVAFDANFESSITSLLQTSFTESSTNAATVTINRTGSTYRSAGVIDAGYLYPGATNTFANSTTDFLNFGATDSFTMMVIYRQWATPTSFCGYLAKRVNGLQGYDMGPNGTALQDAAFIGDGTNFVRRTAASTYTSGTLNSHIGVIDRSTQTNTVYQNAIASAASSISSVGNPTNIMATLLIGQLSGTGWQDFEFIGAAIFRTALTAKNISDINNYFQGRD